MDRTAGITILRKTFLFSSFVFLFLPSLWANGSFCATSHENVAFLFGPSAMMLPQSFQFFPERHGLVDLWEFQFRGLTKNLFCFRGYTEFKYVEYTELRRRSPFTFGSEGWIAKSGIVAAIPRRNHGNGNYEGGPVSAYTMIFNNYTVNSLWN